MRFCCIPKVNSIILNFKISECCAVEIRSWIRISRKSQTAKSCLSINSMSSLGNGIPYKPQPYSEIIQRKNELIITHPDMHLTINTVKTWLVQKIRQITRKSYYRGKTSKDRTKSFANAFIILFSSASFLLLLAALQTLKTEKRYNNFKVI